MSEAAGQESRTEEPSERKVSDALDKGNTPFSREVVTLGTLLAILLVLNVTIGWSMSGLLGVLRILLENAGQIDLSDQTAAVSYLGSVIWQTSRFVLPVVLIVASGGIVASLVQNVPRAAGDRVAPKLSRISLLAGWQRIAGKAAILDFLKTLVKAIVLLAVGAITLRSLEGLLFAMPMSEPGLIPQAILSSMMTIFSAFCVFALILGGADLVMSRRRWHRGLMMTRQELKEEMRQSEGDPHLKSRIRGIARQRSSRKMFAKLPSATMVITNPTHFAVALRYRREDGGAPIVVAKGVDFLALRIREAAEGFEIPLVENRPLARVLYEKVEVNDAIPVEFYRAVAEIIHFLELRRRYPRSPEVLRQ